MAAWLINEVLTKGNDGDMRGDGDSSWGEILGLIEGSLLPRDIAIYKGQREAETPLRQQDNRSRFQRDRKAWGWVWVRWWVSRRVVRCLR